MIKMDRSAANKRYRERHRDALNQARRNSRRLANASNVQISDSHNEGAVHENFVEQNNVPRRTLRNLYKAAVKNSDNFFLPTKCHLGGLSKKCTFCGAMHFKSENTLKCCHNGKLSHLPTSNPNCPLELKNLFLNSDSTSKNFRDFIRQYNNANAFASLGAKVESIPGGVFCYKVSGEIVHASANNIPIDLSLNSSNLCTAVSREMSYAELFFYDTNTAVNIRMGNPLNSVCSRQIMSVLTHVINESSPYAECYRKLRNVYESEINRARSSNTEVRNVSLVFSRNSNDDRRIYNAPSADDVALVFVCDREGNMPANLDFAVHPNSSNQRSLKRLSPFSQHVDPMVFPLFFPNGDFGWTPNMPHNEDRATAVRNKITPLQFYSYKIAMRDNVFNPLLLGGKLFQQYIVHAYARIEAVRLHFIRNNQQALRVESYKGVMDYINSFQNQNNQNIRVGNVFILPSSFVGGPRFMAKLYQDSMAMVRKFGRPDLFITFTCNPNWDEIKSELQPFQHSSDRPDLVTRVFNIKLKLFLDDIVKNKIFGQIQSYFYTIEHQKRGLPHAHCLFTLRNEDKFKTSDEVDSIISAELPDRATCPELHAVVLKHNIHGPCGSLNTTCVCMVDGKCSKNFPKPFCNNTELDSAGYPKYRRRPPVDNSLRPATSSGIEIDNRFVVPYNPFLTVKFDAHINVELCCSVTAVKYLHKYVTKGRDYARLGVQEESNANYDEITQFLNCRYISSQEAAWHIQEFPVHGQSHVVLSLPVHLQDGQLIYFEENDMENALRRNSVRSTMLTEYFELNKTDAHAHQFYYHDIPCHYIFRNNKWIRRSENSSFGVKTIGRMVSVSPKDSELFHLRILLLSIKGAEAVSFESLKQFQNRTFSTFKEAARARGLINDTLEWSNCLSEAAGYMLPRSLRQLFVTILCFCNPSDPVQLFEEHKISFLEDFIHLGLNEEEARHTCYNFFKNHCVELGFDFFVLFPVSNFPEINMSLPQFELTPQHQEPDLWIRLNSDQEDIANQISQSLNAQNAQKCFFIDGPGGCGKTFIYKALIQKFRNEKKFLCIAWTGIAATLLPDGMTCHSAFSLPLNLDSVRFPSLSRSKREFLGSVDCLIWDEAPMAPGVALEIVDLVFRDIMGNDLPFGGKVIVLGGDFRQVLPVVRNGNRVTIINSSIKKSSLWHVFKTHFLTVNMRAINDSTFSSWLLEIGNGTSSCSALYKKTEKSVLIPSQYISADLVTDIFGTSFSSEQVPFMCQRAILCPKNEHVRLINESVLSRLAAEEISYRSIDSVKADDNGLQSELNFPVEFLNTLHPSGLPPHLLNLKKGCVVMLLRNLSTKNGLCNGTRLAVRDFRPNVLKTEIIGGPNSGTIHFIPRITLDTSNDPALPFTFKRHQFPVRLAYAMTINKSQGQTFEKVGLFLPEPCFTHGQLYTAISRTTSANSLRCQLSRGPKQDVISDGGITENIVYREALILP